MATNYEKMQNEIGREHNPFIVYDIETTGIMNGNDNRITQISLVAYAYNRDNGKYELQDQLFMLAKPDEQVIRTLQEVDKARIANPEQTVKDRLIDDYIYNLIKKEPDEEKQTAIRDKRSLYEDYCVIAIDTNSLGLARLSDKDFAIPNKPSSDTLSADDRSVCEGFVRFCNTYGRLQKKIDDVTHEMTIEQLLAKQGLDLEKYIADGKGLTPAEMQVGITEFLNKYRTSNTVFVNNGTHFTKHYMEKENLSFLGYTDDTNKVIDLIQVRRSMRGGNVHFTVDVGTFAENYKKETGKEIKTFDALTKGLCLGEITVKACGMSVSLTSETYLVNKVAESAMSKDNDYVMSNARASAMNWLPASQHAFDIADFHSLPFLTLPFHSLEYVNFGNDRRYVDIDKMFEMNDNFEITLEGEKEPIKTWEELETKIKALNSEISDELLDKIHEKYNEVVEEASDKWKADVEKRYEEGSLWAENMTKEQYEYLDNTYDLSYMHDRYLIDRKIHGELESVEPTKKPVISEQEKSEALIEQLQAIRKENKTLSKEMSELETRGKAIFQKLSNLAYTLVPAIQDIREKVGVDIMNDMPTTGEALTARDMLHTVPNASVRIPMGRVNVELTLYNTDKDKSEQSARFTVVDRYGTSYDENSTGAMKCLAKNDITKDNIVSQFWCNVAHNVQTVIKEESRTTDKLCENVKEMKDTMLSFTKSDVDIEYRMNEHRMNNPYHAR